MFTYGKYVKKLEKKNAKVEKKCAKKGKPFVPVQIPTEEEFANSSTANQNKAGKIILMIILLLLIWFLIYFFIMYVNTAFLCNGCFLNNRCDISSVYIHNDEEN